MLRTESTYEIHHVLKNHQGSLTATICGNTVECSSTYTMRVTLENGKVFSDKVVKE